MTTEEVGRFTSETGGQKGTKLERVDLIPPQELLTVSRVYGKGAEKYEPHNWEKGYPWSLSIAALLRHALQFSAGEDNDEETGEPHMSSVVFHALALLNYMRTHREFDDRPETPQILGWVTDLQPLACVVHGSGSECDGCVA